VIDLFSLVFNKKLAPEYWDWRFVKNPFGKPIIRLCLDDEKLVATYLVHPIVVELNGKTQTGLFSMFTMTDSKYAGLGIMTNLANEVFSIGKQRSHSFVMGFANVNSRYIFTKKLGFSELATMKELTADLPHKISKSRLVCTKIDFFDETFSQFYDSVKQTSLITIPRKADYLNWRFIKNPENKYECYKITHNGELIGYFILKNYQGVKGHIIDFLIKDNQEAYNAMLTSAIDFCNLNNLSKLTLWVNSSLPLYAHLIKNGFYDKQMENFFIYKNLTDHSMEEMGNSKNWYITMSDSDVF